MLLANVLITVSEAFQLTVKFFSMTFTVSICSGREMWEYQDFADSVSYIYN